MFLKNKNILMILVKLKMHSETSSFPVQSQEPISVPLSVSRPYWHAAFFQLPISFYLSFCSSSFSIVPFCQRIVVMMVVVVIV